MPYGPGGFKIVILLPQPPKCWDYRQAQLQQGFLLLILLCQKAIQEKTLAVYSPSNQGCRTESQSGEKRPGYLKSLGPGGLPCPAARLERASPPISIAHREPGMCTEHGPQHLQHRLSPHLSTRELELIFWLLPIQEPREGRQIPTLYAGSARPPNLS